MAAEMNPWDYSTADFGDNVLTVASAGGLFIIPPLILSWSNHTKPEGSGLILTINT